MSAFHDGQVAGRADARSEARYDPLSNPHLLPGSRPVTARPGREDDALAWGYGYVAGWEATLDAEATRDDARRGVR